VARRPCEMGWHPIVYTLLSTPAFPRSQMCSGADLQGCSTSRFDDNVGPRGGEERKARCERGDRSSPREHAKVPATSLSLRS